MKRNNGLLGVAVAVILAVWPTDAVAASMVAHVTLKGVFIPDGTPTDSASLIVRLVTQTPPSTSQTATEGAITLQLNGGGTSGQWVASGILAGVAGVPQGAVWGSNAPAVVNADFFIPFDAPIGDSAIAFELKLGGRDVHQYFSDEHLAPSGLLLGDQHDFGLTVLEVIPAAGGGDITVEYLPSTTRLTATASDSSNVPSADLLLSNASSASVFLSGAGDASTQYLGGNSLRLQTFTYHSFTTFQIAEATLRPTNRGIFESQGFRSNLRITAVPEPGAGGGLLAGGFFVAACFRRRAL